MHTKVTLKHVPENAAHKNAGTAANTVGRAYAFLVSSCRHPSDIRRALVSLKAVPDILPGLDDIDKRLKKLVLTDGEASHDDSFADELRGLRESMLRIPPHARFSVCTISQIGRGSPSIGTREEWLVSYADEWRSRGANHFIRALLPKATNREAAELLDGILGTIEFRVDVFGGVQTPLCGIYLQDGMGVRISLSELKTAARANAEIAAGGTVAGAQK